MTTLARPLVSVIMGVYDEPEHWLRASIESILNQTLNDFEFIIINDNPEAERIKSILDEFSKVDQRVVIIENIENIGLTSSLNKGLNIARGKYVARMDGDDVAVENRLQVQLSFFLQNPDYFACGSWAYIIREDKLTNKIEKKPTSDAEIRTTLFFECPLIHPTLMVNKELLDGYLIRYDPAFRFAQDYKLISDILKHGKAFNVKQPLLYYRVSQRQISSAKLREQNAFSTSIRDNNVFEYLKRDPIKLKNLSAISQANILSTLYRNLRGAKKERHNLSAIIYSLLYYKEPHSLKRTYLIFALQPYLILANKYRVRLLASTIFRFRDRIH